MNAAAAPAGPRSGQERVSLLGLGAMGSPMADVLRAAGVPLVVWNRSAARSARFAGTEVDVAASPAGAATSVVLTVLPDLADVRSVLEGPEGLLAGWEAQHATSPLLLIMGTVSPVDVVGLARELAASGVRVLDAPVSGGVVGAAEARLSIMVGGDPRDVEQVRPVLEVLGRTVRHLGPVGSGQLAKACNQMIVASTVTAVSEAMLLARATGLDPVVLTELLRGGLADSEVLRQKGHHWIDEDFTPGGTLAYQLKDLTFALDAAGEAGVVLPVSHLVRELFAVAVAEGDGALDHTAIHRTVQRLSGREPPSTTR